MDAEEIMYRPPFEANSFLLEVTKGCSHNQCAFCTMYRSVPFRVLPLEAVEVQLKNAQPYADRIERVFLENGDPFALDADHLLAIADRIHHYLPRVRTIAMYAQIKNLFGKTDAELKKLCQAGINDLNIGVESGLDRVLSHMNKGYTAAQAKEELNRLKVAGMDWTANVIFGAAGAGHGRENAETTAELLNETVPSLIFTGTIHADAGCPLFEEMQDSRFEEPTIGEYLDEEECFLRRLHVSHCLYFGLHPSNVVPLAGLLPDEKEQMMCELSSARDDLGTLLARKPRRGGEGAILLKR